LNRGIAVGTRAEGAGRVAVLWSVGLHERGAVCGTGGTCGEVDIPAARKNLGEGLIVSLVQIVGFAVELITELEVMRAPPSALEPGEILVELDVLIGVAEGVVYVLGSVEVSGCLLK